ncbi:metalloregulator ArsR/SmtB family transcription factor [Thermoplasma sp.]|uniref:helix-turn-helix transcriptional regulator n=1 Tax=Thermoplasma sp. TaxID=1973142 RepID=UPI00261F5C7B|nr:metalloregulator ArsR/SmtB family transcription factor [Thermoplasma sp.]
MIYEDILGTTKTTILESLNVQDRSIDDLSNLLKINKTAVKEHLEYLEMRGYVTSYFQSGGAGRPKKYYKLTEKGISLFPKKYIDFAKLLLDETERVVGTQRMNEILERIASRMISDTGWLAEDLHDKPREEKIKKIQEYVSMLNILGYNATLDIYSDRVIISRHNCIFYDLAKTNNRIICNSLGKDLIVQSLNADFEITEKISSGSSKCVIEVKL